MRLVAFHLPQFHPVPENDLWWGKGFTEWTNVTRARPLFPGHSQPHLPADLGFYDLRLPEARQAQADLAREYGIGAFCYYHYWFSGRRILERPVDEILATGQPDFPFCLCWANENWTRAWDGGEKEILLGQSHDAEDFLAHARWLAQAFADPRYLKEDGKPVFLVYRASAIEGLDEFVRVLREQASLLGLPDVHLVRVESFPTETGPLPTGFDASLEFQPSRGLYDRPLKRGFFRRQLMRLGLLPKAHLVHDVRSYPELARKALEPRTSEGTRYRCVTPMWDNSARRKQGATIFVDSTPELYRNWLAGALRRSRSEGHGLVFVNAWNEWAEGNHLEPCQRWGRAYLEATRAASLDAL